MLDFSIVDSHVHLCNRQRLSYAWVRRAPRLDRLVLPEHLTQAAALELAGTYCGRVDIVDEISHGTGEHDRRKLFRDNAISFYRLSH
jgi:predicted TIM-barrel fold metal-dependent hydrolase